MEQLVLDRFKRVNDKVSPELIGNDEVTEFYDAVLDYKIGKPVKRGHFSRYDAGVTAGSAINKIDDVISDAGVQYLIATNNTNLISYNITTNTWGNIDSVSSGTKFKKVPFADKFIFCFDSDKDPIILSNDMTTVWGLELGTAVVTGIRSYHKGSGNLEITSFYKWLIVGVTEDGQYSPPSQPFTHFFDTQRILTTDDGTNGTTIYFKDVPYIADTRIISRIIFRTKSSDSGGNNNVFYPLVTLDNDPTGVEYQKSFEDNTADIDLGTEITIFLNTPTRTKHLAFSNERLFLGNFSQTDKNFLSPCSSYVAYDGAHTGGNNSVVLGDSTQNWIPNEHLGKIIYNITDGSSGTVITNSTNVLAVTLGGGSDNDWDTGDVYLILPSGYGYASSGYQLTPTDGTGNGGTLLDSTPYDYRFHYFDKYGRLSEYYLPISLTTSPGTDDDNHDITVQGLGTLAIDIAQETTVKVYRRTGGTGSYYLILETDATGGSNIGVTYDPQGGFRDYGGGDLTETWADPATNIKTYPSAICFSDISAPSIIRDENKRQIIQDDGEAITGLFSDADGIVVFKENSICKLYLSGDPNNWKLYKLIDYIGAEENTVQRIGNVFYFVFNNKAYRYQVGGVPEDIGKFFQKTLDIITSWLDSTINERWYVLQGYESTGTSYITLVYDILIDTWYYFTRTQSAAEVFKTCHFIKYGSEAGKLLSNCDNYVSLYNDVTISSSDTRVDTETGTSIDIAPIIKTKTFTFGDAITKARLRKLKFVYTKVTGKTLGIDIKDENAAASNTVTDTTGSGIKLFTPAIGGDLQSLKKVKTLSIKVYGSGFLEWDSLRLEYRPIREGQAVGN